MDKEQINQMLKAAANQAIDAVEKRLKIILINEIEKRFNALRGRNG